jgi:hypothetical protein
LLARQTSRPTAAFGPSGKQADTSGALQEIASHPGGIVVLWLLAAGFAGLELWWAHRGRLPTGTGGRTPGKRLLSLAFGFLWRGPRRCRQFHPRHRR